MDLQNVGSHRKIGENDRGDSLVIPVENDLHLQAGRRGGDFQGSCLGGFFRASRGKENGNKDRRNKDRGKGDPPHTTKSGGERLKVWIQNEPRARTGGYPAITTKNFVIYRNSLFSKGLLSSMSRLKSFAAVLIVLAAIIAAGCLSLGQSQQPTLGMVSSGSGGLSYAVPAPIYAPAEKSCQSTRQHQQAAPTRQ